MPQGQVLKHFLNVEDQIMEPSMLDSLLEFETTDLKKAAACHSIKFDPETLMTPLLDEVYKGIAGFRHNDPNVFSCTALGLELQIPEM